MTDHVGRSPEGVGTPTDETIALRDTWREAIDAASTGYPEHER